MTQSPLQRYRALLKLGRFNPDAAQERAATALNALHRALKDYRPRARGFLTRALKGKGFTPPKGLYIHGDVGRGKSALMDLFFASVAIQKKRRVHFNAFMAETHRRIHAWRKLSPSQRRRRPEFLRDAGEDPVAPVAKRIQLEATLLCLDEFQVLDVADGMILGRLFEKLFAYGVIVVLTSNTAPDQLYEGGLNRQLFLPFIALIKERLQLVELNGPRDYRLDKMAGLNAYSCPLGAKADTAMDAAWRHLTDSDKGQSLALTVMQRKLIVPEAARGVARFPFDALCREALGAADYLALARKFHTILIDGIPRLLPHHANEARRFTLLIDTLYDEGVKLVCSAASPPKELYVNGDGAQAFRRAASRLMEMQSAEYLQARAKARVLETAL